MFETSNSQQNLTQANPTVSQAQSTDKAITADYHLPNDLPPSPTIKKRSRWPLLIVLIVGLIGLMGGGAWAYTYYFPSPETVLAKALKNFALIESESFDGSITIAYQPTNALADESSPFPIPKSLTIDINGEVNSKDVTNPEMNLSLGLSSDEIPFGRVEGDILVADKTFFFRLRRYPEFPFFDLTPIRNQWIRVESKDLPNGEEIFTDTLTEDQNTRIEALTQKYPLASFAKSLGDENLNGEMTYHYQLNFNKENLKQLILEVIPILGETSDDYKNITEESKAELGKILDKITFTNWEVWINKKTFYFSKVLLSISMADEMGTVSITTTMSSGRHNENIDIVAPESSLTVDEVTRIFEQQFAPATSSLEALPGSDLEFPTDSDQDGLPDAMEEIFGTDPLKADTDDDGFSDNDEIENGYNPLGPGKSDNF